MSPSETLRAAATLIRETASTATPGGKWVTCASMSGSGLMDVIAGGSYAAQECTPEAAAWIALMHPGLAEHLAAVLEDHATDHGTYDCPWDDGECPPARLARSILGRTS